MCTCMCGNNGRCWSNDYCVYAGLIQYIVYYYHYTVLLPVSAFRRGMPTALGRGPPRQNGSEWCSHGTTGRELMQTALSARR